MAQRSRATRHSQQSRACDSCYRRKVRCDVISTGLPCSPCDSSDIVCKMRTRKAYPDRTRWHSTAAHNHPSSAPVNSVRAPISTNFTAIESISDPPTAAKESKDPAGFMLEHRVDENDISLRNIDEIDALTTAVIDGESLGGESSVFVGDQQGIGYLLDAMNGDGPARPQHYLVPRRTASLLQPDDLIFLKRKGCFSMPSTEVSDGLIECYFKYTHPMFPILDMDEFLETYTARGAKGCNLLLLWSIFSVAGSFIDDKLLCLTSYKSRKDLKRSSYERAKCLYDNGGEEDMIVLTQSALLLGFWFPGTENHTASWHWTGRAISIAQSLGLHRNSDAKQTNKAVSESRRRIWRRIWWACFFRDRWLSFGMGRPMRINEDDCDVPKPTTEDILGDLKPNTNWQTYIPSDLAKLSQIWVDLIRLSIILGRVLVMNYQPRKSTPSTAEVEDLEKLLCEIFQGETTMNESKLLCELYEGNIRLCREAVIIALYRPFDKNKYQHGTLDVLSATAHQKILSAAGTTNAILERMMATNCIGFLGPMTPTLLVPAMHTHLLQSKSENSLTKSLGLHRLELCLLILQELEHNYPAATALRTLFLRARAVITREKLNQPPLGNTIFHETHLQPSALASTGSTHSRFLAESDRYLEAMFSESSIYYPPVQDFNIAPYSTSDTIANFELSNDEFISSIMCHNLGQNSVMQ